MNSVVTFYWTAIVLGLAICVTGQSTQCTIDGVGDSQWNSILNIQINDTHKGTTFTGATSNTNSLISVDDLSNMKYPYVKVELIDKELIITLEEMFNEFEEYETVPQINIRLTFSCTGSSRTLIVRHTITDTNNHEPVFLPNNNFNIPIFTPLAVGFPIVPIFETIYVKDVDLTNTAIIPSIEPNEYFDFTYDGTNGTVKIHKFKLVVKKVLYGLEEPAILQITATDKDNTGDPPHTTNGIVKIDSDPTVKIPVTPSFSMPFYRSTFIDGELIFDEKIVIDQGYDELDGLKLDGEHSEYFDCNQNGKEVEIVILNPLPEDVIKQNFFLLFSLEATKLDTPGGKTAINVKLPRDDATLEILRFNELFYNYTYEEEKLSGPGIILIEGYDNNITIALDGDHHKYFEIKVNSETINIELKTEILLPPEIIDDNNFIVLYIKAENSRQVSTKSVVTVNFPKSDISQMTIIKFQKAFYNYNYTEDGILDGPNVIVSEGYSSTIDFDIKGELSSHFTPIHLDGKVQFQVIDPLSDDFLKENQHILLVLDAKDTISIPANTTIIITLPPREDNPEKILKFRDPFYDYTYLANDTLIGPEIVLLDDHNIDIQYSLIGDNREYFKITPKENNIVILELDGVLSHEILNGNIFLILILEAKGDNMMPGSTILTIELPKKETILENVLEFEKPFYNFTYTIDNEITGSEIELSVEYDIELDFELIGDTQNFFSIEHSEMKLTLGVKENLPESVIMNNQYVTLILEARGDNYKTGITVLTIELPKKEIILELEFKRPFYNFTYTIDNKITGSEIELSEKYDIDLNFELIGDTQNFFSIEHSEMKLTLGVKENLPESVIMNNQYVTLILEARGDNYKTGITVLTIELPKKEIILELEFKRPFYNFTYTIDNKITGSEIELSEKYDIDLNFELIGDTQNFFSIEHSEMKLTLGVKENLPESVIMNNQYVTLILEARGDNYKTGITVLTIELPKKEIILELQFKRPFYNFTYTIDNKITGSEVELSEKYDIDLNFELIGDTQNFFSIEHSEMKLTLGVKENLPESIIMNNQYLTLILEARGDNYKTGVTVLTIELPNPAVQNILKFEVPFYNLSYTEDNELLEHDIILQDCAEGTKFILEGYAKEYFVAESSNSKNVKIKVKEELPPHILEENCYLILVLQATADNIESGITIVNINLPRKEDNPENFLKFRDPFYDYTYLANDTLIGPEIVLLDDHNIDIQYSLIGDNREYFKITPKENNIVILELDKVLSHEILNGNIFLILILEAKGDNMMPGSTILTIELPKKEIILENLLEFKRPFYNFTYTIDNEITGSEIELSEEYDIELDFELIGDTRNFFSIDHSEMKLTLGVRENLPESITMNNQYLTLILEARGDNYKTGVTVLTIELPNPAVQNILKFEVPFYNLSYTEDNELLEHDIILQDCAEGTKFILEGYAKEYFVAESSNSKNVKIKVKEELPPHILEENCYLILVLQATADNIESGITIVNINLPRKDAITTALFNKPYYEGTYSDGNLDMADINVNGYEDDIQFFITGENSEYFTPKYENEKIIIESDGLPELIANTDGIIVLTLDGRKSFDKIAWATLIITVKKRTDIKLEFDSQFYYANISTSTMGTIIKVRAVASDNSKIRYENIITDDYLRPLIEIDEEFGSISVRSFINEGHYKFQVKAMTAQNEDFAMVELGVFEDGTLEIHLNPLVVVDITEHHPSSDIGVKLDLMTGCIYEIEDAWPTGRDWFIINQNDGSIACKDIDREDDKIAHMHVSQVQLKLSCKNTTPENTRNVCLNPTVQSYDKTNVTRTWIFTEDIILSNNRFITVIVNDINDQKPVFNEDSPLTVGYPTGQLASILKPPYLVKVHATDKDIGLNAKIKYVTESDYFAIHPESGVIYPKEDFLNQDMKLTVSAWDQDGEGNKTDLSISIKMIDIDHLTVIHIKKALSEDTNNVLESISNKINIKLKSLMSIVLPPNEDNTRKYKNVWSSNRVIRSKRSEVDSDSVLTIFAYAFDENGNFISSDDLTSKIEDDAEGMPWSIDSEKLSQSFLLSGGITFTDNGGLVIAVSIVSALLILLIIAIVVWFLVILPRNYLRFENDSSRGSVNSMNSEYEKNSEISPDDIPNIINRDPMISSLEGGNIPEQITKDKKPNSTAEEDNYGKIEITTPDNFKKSTVKFKETVQQIDIIEYEEDKF
ncbi:uncharacterized protein LOC143919491 [Arctopsyche grandis]|uniref:uncharacterized protein LOC143919491 n=1 Tax=Arctopsyche grandis TaxID=121162 RepID=UPI00406D8CA2